MYAIVDIAGQQFKVRKDQKIFVHRLEGKSGSKVNFDQVLLIDNDKDIIIGEPVIKGAIITGKIMSHPKGDKVMVFKKKKRKGYQVLKGHRQLYTEVQIEEILEKGGAKTATAAAKEKAEPKKSAPAKKETKPKATTTKKAPAATKTTEKKAPVASTTKKATAEKKDTKSPAKPATSAKKPAAKTTAKATPKKTTAAKKPAAKKTDESKKK